MLCFSIHTIGCKLNQLESEAVADAFHREGFPVIPWEAPDGPGYGRRLMVLNTCTVTSMAEQKARRLIRGALREGAWVLVTGCYAQLNAAELEALGAEDGAPGRLFVIPGDKKSALLDLPRFLCSSPGEDPLALVQNWLLGAGGGDGPQEPFRFAPNDFSAHTRGFLKIQDGCDRHCTYCRVRLARGGALSLPPEEALRRLRALEARGCAEVVLTGVNICRYAAGLSGGASGAPGGQGPSPMGLGALVDYLLGGTERIRLRLSSLEPEDIDERLLESLKNRRLRPHFHLSVQSGSGGVLKRMGRPYGPERVEWVVSRLRDIKGDPFLACDIITGFPGEGEADFAETEGLCRRVDFAWIHSFPYSSRPGTAARNFGGQVPQRVSALRAAKLLELARRGRGNYVARWVGKDTELVLETKAPPCPPGWRGGEEFWAGTSENYLKLMVPRPWLPADHNGVLRCRIRDFSALLPGSPSAGGGQGAGNLGNFDALGDPR